MVDPSIAAAAFLHTHDLVLAINAQGEVVSANPAVTPVLGLEPAAVLGTRFWALCGPGQAQRELLTRAARGEVALESLPLDDALVAADGTVRSVTWRWARAGSLLVAIGRDVTSERRAGEARRTSEERFQIAARAARDMIYDFDVVTGRISWGANAHEVFGLNLADLGTNIDAWASRIHPEDLARVDEKLRAAIDRGTTYEDEYRFRGGDGDWATVRDRGFVLTGPDGRAVRMIGSMENVTEARRAHAELADSEARYRFIAETTTDLVYDLDIVNDTLSYMSPRVEQWLGVSLERLKTESGLWWRLIADADRDRVFRAFAADLAARRVRVRYEYRIQKPDGTWRDVHDVGAVTYDADGRALRLRGTVSDVGEMRALQAELAQAQKLESVGRLAGGIAHDFNNLLTGMLANLSLARLQASAGDGAAHLDEVERAIERASSLVRGLLAYSRRATLSLQPVDLRECVAAVVRLIKPTLGPKVLVSTDAAAGLPLAWADAARVEQVLVNLALNARDAMPDGGSLRFALDAVQAAPPKSGAPGSFLRVIVEDTGVGMTPEVRARAFEPFFTTKAERGTGLGLAIVLGIVTQHTGWVECTSEVGRGTRFVLHLPVAAVGSATAPRPAPEAGEPRGGETVLVADDEPSIRRAVRPLLENFGFGVLTARDGQEAVEVFRRSTDVVRAVVLDLTMPRLSGQEALEAIRHIDPTVPVIIATGYAVDGLTELPGVTAVVSKPYHPAELARTLRRVIDARAATRPRPRASS